MAVDSVPPRRQKIDAALALALGTTAASFAIDYWLVRSGRRPYSDLIRDNAVVVVALLAVLGLHVARKLGPYDPFVIVGDLTGLRSVAKRGASA